MHKTTASIPRLTDPPINAGQEPGFGSLLYRGRNSRIYHCASDDRGRATVVKVLNDRFPSDRQITDFYTEFDIVSSLTCAGVRRAYEKRHEHGEHILVLEYVAGRPLRQLARGALDVELFLRAAISIARTLSEVHAHGIIHKDINGDNILWGDERTHLIDFGISARIETNVAYERNPDRLEGTLAYMSPEQTGRLHRVLDYRTDLYSLGVTLYELFTGHLPFETRDVIELVHAHIAKPCPPACERRSSVPVVISNIIAKLMAKDPEARYQSATGLGHDLERCLTQWRSGQHIEAFELGARDVCVRFCIPQTLYGREREVAELLRAFDRVSGGGTELVLVGGYSGVGKTSLVREIQKPITAKQGFFVSGKFDQLQRSQPYSALIQAMSELVAHVLSENEQKLTVWRHRIQDAVRDLGQVLVDVVPSLELVIGHQPAVTTLDPIRTQNRFDLVLRRFIRHMSQAQHPLVIFIDDLQWADLASLHLLEVLLTDGDIGHFLVVGAYRDNEVDDLHPLSQLRRKLAHDPRSRVHEVVLHNLSLGDMNQLVADALRCDPADARPLAELIHGKTHGNAFFTCRFLQGLYDDRLIRCSANAAGWEWNIADIAALNITDNVVDFLVHKVQSTSAEAQNILRLAACIGNRFRLATLAIVSERPASEVLDALWEPLRAGLVVPLDNHYKAVAHLEGNSEFRFLHDRVQQAAYALVGDDERKLVHLTIGRLLREEATDADLDGKLFQIVGHLNRSQDLISDRHERLQLAELDLRAGVKAKSSGAHDSAATILESGIASLPRDAWDTVHQLAFELHLELADCVFLTGEFARATELLDLVLLHCTTDTECGRAFVQKIAQHTIQGLYFEAIHIGIRALAEMGVKLPALEDQDGIKAYVVRMQASFNARWGDRPIRELFDLPVTEDPVQELVRGILLNLVDCGVIAAPHYLPILGLTTVNLSLAHGNSNNSSYGYITHGINLAAIEHDYQGAFEFGMVGLRLMQDKLRDMRVTCKTLNGVGGFLYFYRESMADTIDLMERGYTAGIEGGDFVHSSYCLVNGHRNLVSSGMSLARVAEKTDDYLESLGKINANVMHEVLRGSSGAFVKYMTGQSRSARTFDSDDFDHGAFLEKYRAVRLFSVFANIYKIIGFYILQEDDLALAEIADFEACLPFADNYVHGEEYRLFTALLLLRVHPAANAADKPARWQRIRELHQFVSKAADAAPVNFRSHERLIAAEIARVEGKPDAWELYDQAIAAAATAKQLQYLAIANECAARFWRERGKVEVAALHLTRAHYHYVQWGASRKVKALELQHGELLCPSSPTIEGTFTGSGTGNYAIDTDSLVRSLQALSRQVHVDGLLAAVMKLVMESAGAETAVVVRPTRAGLHIVAQASSSDCIRVETTPATGSDALCMQIVHYVHRSKETVILDNALHSPEYAAVPYIRDKRVMSLLCLPILLHDEVSAILYLENNLTSKAFTESRVELLALLSSQIAISLQNATFYEELEHKVAQRTRDLKAAQQQLVEIAYNDGMAELAIDVLHNVGNALNSVQVSAQCVRDRASASKARQLVDIVRRVRERRQAEDGEESADKILDYYAALAQLLTDEAEAIRAESVRLADSVGMISEIVAQQRKYARTGNPPEPVELANIVDEVLALEAGACADLGIIVTTEYRGDARVMVYRHRLVHMVLCLLKNAREALAEVPAGSRSLHLAIEVDEDGTRLEMRDTGCGIASEHLDHIFEHRFTTKSGRNGFDLHTCANYMGGIGGEIGATSEGTGMGTSVVLKFPSVAQVRSADAR